MKSNEYQKEMEALKAECEKLRKGLERMAAPEWDETERSGV